jgi:uncharacterized membrane protein YeaQ/YmgE (transglycosylase-associated protein family)
MYIIYWLLFGAVVGWIASILTRDNGRMGLIANIVVGLIGSAIGSLIAGVFQLAPIDKFSFGGFAFAILGAVVLLSIINWLQGRRH